MTAALLWYVLHGEDEPDDDSALMAAARRFATRLLRNLKRQSATTVPLPTGEDRDKWIDGKARDIVKQAVDEAAAHYSTVFKRVRRENPQATDRQVKTEFANDKPWAKAAARTAATRQSAETALSMRDDVEKMTGLKHSTMWVSRGDPKVRSLHRDLHGRVRPVGDPYYTWPDGQTLDYPGDMTAPIDAWINCRCALMLVPSRDAHKAESIFQVPDQTDFDVPMAASVIPSSRQQAERELRQEFVQRLLTGNPQG